MNGVAFFDMGNYPTTHMICVILFALPLNLLFIINYVDMLQIVKQRDTKYLIFKLVLLILSFGGIALFTLLGRIEHCKSVVITIEECLQLTSEDTCFQYVDPYRDGWTILRNYPRCHVMHFWRGLAEWVAVLSSAEYVHCLYWDRNTVQVLLYKQMGIFSNNSFILREIAKECEEKNTVEV